jgi:hypothetical protein
MPRDTNTGQRKEVELNRGLFLVHYKSAEDEAFPPLVKVFPAPGHERQIQIHTHPDSDPNTLWQPNTSLVVRANTAATLHVEVLPGRANGSRNAAVRIEPINQGKANQPIEFSEQELPDLDQIRILGHVAGIGDVMVSADEWIAGPSAPSRIEGISIEWPQQSGLELRYAVKSGTQTGKMIEAGEFAGTRGRAMPLTGLILELSGKFSDTYQIAADAIFLSSPTMRVIGKRVVLSGPTGREPLVGLRLRIESTEQEPVAALRAAKPERAAQSAVSPKAAAKPASSGKVRVFRSRTKQPSD